MGKKMLFIFNPHSGKGKIKNYLFEIIERFSDADYEVTIHPTKQSGDCKKKIKESAKRFDLVVVAGGDGTLNEAVSGMLALDKCDRIPIGYIPSGTMNDFASTNNISPTPVDAADQIIFGKHIPYDIGLLNGRTFIYVAAFGAFTDVSYETPQINKNILGSMAYFLECLKSLPKIKGINAEITDSHGNTHTVNASLLLIMNSTSVAGFEFGEFYDIDTSDGLFEIVVVPKSVNILDLPAIINGIKNGERSINGAYLISASKAVIKTDEPVKWTLDGEFGGETNYAEFSVLHKGVNFFMSKSNKND